MEGVRRWWQELAGLVLPAECGGCGSARTVLCPQCRTALGGAAPFRVRPLLEPPGLPAVHAAAHYADEVRAVLLAHKERGALALTRPLGAALAGAVRAGLREAGAEGLGEGEGVGPRYPRGVLLVPVPSARAAVRARGHDPARRIALAAAGELRRAGVPVRVAAVLRQRRPVADQAGLGSRERLDNLVGALTVVPGGVRVLCGAAVVLVDDLVTTGASLAEAARAVRAATEAGTRAETGAGRGAQTGAGRRAGARAGRMDGGGAGTGGVRYAGEADIGEQGGEAEGGMCGGGVGAVYGGATREGRKVKPSGAKEGGRGGAPSGPPPGVSGPGRPGDVLCAAVVAASPDSFEINRN
ncbi:ComF family protein [Streptomyces humidus]|uniref:ComF family protein n=1 Tax=Streptomyces humidus TaxID=52259 RepID=UPI00167C72C3|nr:ComF family protein [Streptomyces humidus]